MSYYQVKVTTTGGSIYYIAFNHLEYGRDIGDPGRFTCELKEVIKAERDVFDKGYVIEIYRDSVHEFKGIIDNRRHRGKTMILEGIDYNSVKLAGKQIMNRKFTSWTNTQILIGKQDVLLTAFSSGAKVALISDAAGDVQQATVYGIIGDAEPKMEKIQLNGTTQVLTTNTFNEVWFVELSSVAVGSVLVKQGSGGTTRATITAGLTIASAVDSDGHFGNSLLYSTGVNDGTITAYSGGAITVDFNGISALKAVQELCELCIDATSLRPMEWSCDYSAGNKINMLTTLGTSKITSVILSNGNECIILDRFENTSNIVNYQTVESRVDGTQQVLRASSSDATSISTYGKRSLPRMPVFHNITDTTILQNIADRIIDEGKDANQEVSLGDVSTAVVIVLGDVIKVVDTETDFNTNMRVKGIMTVVDGTKDRYMINLFPSGGGTEMMDRVNNLSDIGKAISNISDFGAVMEVTRKDIQEMVYVLSGKASSTVSGQPLQRGLKFPDSCLSPGDIIECIMTITREYLKYDQNNETDETISGGEGNIWTRKEGGTGLINGTWQEGATVHTLDEYDYLWHHIFVSVCFGSTGGTAASSFDAVHIRAVLERWTDGAFVDTEFYPDENTGMSIAERVNQYYAQDFNITGNLMIPGCLSTHWKSMDASHPDRIRLDIKVTDETEFDASFESSYLYSSMKVPSFGIPQDNYPTIAAEDATLTIDYRVDSTTVTSPDIYIMQTSDEINILSLLNLSGAGWRYHTLQLDPTTAGKITELNVMIKLRYYANNV